MILVQSQSHEEPKSHKEKSIDFFVPPLRLCAFAAEFFLLPNKNPLARSGRREFVVPPEFANREITARLIAR